MTNEFLHFEKISRQTWQSLHRKTTPPLTEEELDSIKSFNDQISLQDVTDIYLPLVHLICCPSSLNYRIFIICGQTVAII